jgi:ATP-dependent Zn protease
MSSIEKEFSKILEKIAAVAIISTIAGTSYIFQKILRRLYGHYKLWFSDYSAKMHYTVAVHESGHALIQYLVQGTVPKYMSNKSNGLSNRGIVHNPTKNLDSIKEMEETIKFLYGGPVAEEVIFGFTDVGSSADKQNVKRLSNLIGKAKNTLYDEVDTWEYKQDKELQKHYDYTKMLIEVNTDKLLALADALMKHRFLLQKHIEQILTDKPMVITWFDQLCIYYKFYMHYCRLDD